MLLQLCNASGAGTATTTIATAAAARAIAANSGTGTTTTIAASSSTGDIMRRLFWAVLCGVQSHHSGGVQTALRQRCAYLQLLQVGGDQELQGEMHRQLM